MRNYDLTALRILNTENCPAAKWCKQSNKDKKECSARIGYTDGSQRRGHCPNALFAFFNDTDGKYECQDGPLKEHNGGNLMHELLHVLGIFLVIRFNIIKVPAITFSKLNYAFPLLMKCKVFYMNISAATATNISKPSHALGTSVLIVLILNHINVLMMTTTPITTTAPLCIIPEEIGEEIVSSNLNSKFLAS